MKKTILIILILVSGDCYGQHSFSDINIDNLLMYAKMRPGAMIKYLGSMNRPWLVKSERIVPKIAMIEKIMIRDDDTSHKIISMYNDESDDLLYESPDLYFYTNTIEVLQRKGLAPTYGERKGDAEAEIWDNLRTDPFNGIMVIIVKYYNGNHIVNYKYTVQIYGN